MNLRQLRYFVQVGKSGSFGRASAELGVVQSALSRHVKNLEHELGVTLLNRNPKGVALTPAGRHLLSQSDELLRTLDRIKAEVMNYDAAAAADLCARADAIGLPCTAKPALRAFSRSD